MKIIGIIPARWASTRFEGKVLAKINGRPMIQHVWQQAKKCKKLDDVIIACDDERILKTASDFGAKAVMTSKHHLSGTDRIAEAVQKLNAEVLINIQGDEPLIEPVVIDNLAETFQDKNINIATVIKKIKEQDEFDNPNVVKVVIDKNGYALYFSRAPIPYNREGSSVSQLKGYKHLGLYGYRKEFLFMISKMPASYLEQREQLEQLRILEAGYKIKTIETEFETIGVDTPQDLKQVEELLARQK